MFEFEDLDAMSRLIMLKKQKDTKDYWRRIYRLKGAFLAWGDKTSDLIHEYALMGRDEKFKVTLGDAAIRGEITVKKLANLLEKIDAYLADMDARLGDGTKWNTAAEISKMFNDSVEK